jgi:hypothetical protein
MVRVLFLININKKEGASIHILRDLKDSLFLLAQPFYVTAKLRLCSVKWNTNDDKKGMWKYVVMACTEELPQHSPQVSEENYEKPHQEQLTFKLSEV